MLLGHVNVFHTSAQSVLPSANISSTLSPASVRQNYIGSPPLSQTQTKRLGPSLLPYRTSQFCQIGRGIIAMILSAFQKKTSRRGESPGKCLATSLSEILPTQIPEPETFPRNLRFGIFWYCIDKSSCKTLEQLYIKFTSCLRA